MSLPMRFRMALLLGSSPLKCSLALDGPRELVSRLRQTGWLILSSAQSFRRCLFPSAGGLFFSSGCGVWSQACSRSSSSPKPPTSPWNKLLRFLGIIFKPMRRISVVRFSGRSGLRPVCRVKVLRVLDLDLPLSWCVR